MALRDVIHKAWRAFARPWGPRIKVSVLIIVTVLMAAACGGQPATYSPDFSYQNGRIHHLYC